MININQLLQKPIETLLAVFFNTTQNEDNNFEVKSDYRETKFLKITNDSHKQTAICLSNKYSLAFECINKTSIVSIVENDKNLRLDDFLDLVYEKIIVDLKKIPNNYPLDIEMAIAIFIFRGSADFNHGFYSVDLKNLNQNYTDNLFKLLLSSDELLSRLNLNFRELQPQFVSGSNIRNTQIRINLKWFYDNAISKINSINKYKADVLVNNLAKLGEIRKYPSFEKRLVFYRQSVIGRELTEKEIDVLRQELDFSLKIEQESVSVFSRRNQKIVSYARETFPDICVGCNNKYKIADRSFIMPRNDRYYFEINHVIAYSSDSNSVDVLDNLVKLCPTCHRALTPGRAYDVLQKSIIKNMINSRKEVKKFITSMMQNNSLSDIDYVFSMLK